MNIKSILLASVAAAICSTASAQDKIYKRSGDVIEGKIIEVGTKTISYKKADNPDGPNYVIEKGNIDRIEYQNGTEEYVDDRRRMMHHDEEETERKRPKVHYGNNIIAIAPLQVTDAGVGVGLSYERVLDRRGYVSFYMPMSWSFINDNSGPYYNNNDYRNNTFYFMPGLKFYPTGCRGKVRYSIGPNIVAGFGREWQNVYYSYNYPPYNYPYNYPGYYVREQNDRFTLGVMVNNSLNINPTPHLYLGLELGLGVSYINQLNSYNDDERFLAQFGFKLGYRF
ncbi:MAG: hypothetical protein JST70_14380 [Bacteroidetes bacterium]|nr:hypothetical protein [Bacteroidota bacterium]